MRSLASEECWLEGLGEIGAVARDLRDQLVEDQGGAENLPETRRLLTEQVVRKWLLVENGYRYLLGAGGGPVDRRRRQLKPIVKQLDQLEGSLARDLQALGLERRERPVQTLRDYVRSRDLAQSDEPEPASAEAPPS